jgi:hypothetical protein
MNSGNEWMKQLDSLLELLRKATPNHPVFRGGKFAIMTGEKPKYGIHPGFEGENNTLLNHLEEMKRSGHLASYEPVLGKYGEWENSFILHRPNFEKVKELGEKFGQESVVLSNNGRHQLVYTNGENKGMARPHLPPESASNVGSGVVQHSTEPGDLYSSGKDLQGNKMIFTIPLNFDTTVPVKTKPTMGKSEGGSGVDFPLHFDMTKLEPAHAEDKKLHIIQAFRRTYGQQRQQAGGIAG